MQGLSHFERRGIKMRGTAGPINFIIILIFMAIPLIVLYFIIKKAIKNAIKELKKENIL